jgi:hypothetical protein
VPKKKMKIAWWALRPGDNPVLHAVRDGRDAAMCGWKLNEESEEVRGPKTIAKHHQCVRCVAQLTRFELMT